MAKLLDLVRAKPAAQRTVVPAEIETLLGDLSVVEGPHDVGSGASHGKVQLEVQHSLFGFASLNLSKDLFPEVDFDLTDLGPSAAPDGFRVDLIIATPSKLGTLAEGFLKGGAYNIKGAGQAKEEWIEARPDPAPVEIQGPALVIRIDGRAGEAASLAIKPRPGNEAVEGIVTIQFDPPFVAFGSTGFGLGLPSGIILDDSDTEHPPSAHDADGNVLPSDSDAAAWRGIAIRDAELFIPRGIPGIGGTKIPIHLELGKPSGIDASIKVHVKGEGDRPDITGQIEVRDPAATSIAECLPTLVELVVEVEPKTLPGVDGGQGGNTGVTLGGGKPLRMKATFARDPRVQPNSMTFTLGLEAVGADGLVSISAPGGGPAAKVFITAAVLATALIADSQFSTAPSGDASGTYLHLILTAAVGVSAFFKNDGAVVIHGVELISDGVTSSLVDALRLRVDYSVDAAVTTFTVGVLNVGMKDDSRMRVRYRDVVLEVNLKETGLKMFHLAFDKATAEIDDPGNWFVESPGSILDFIGTRSGRGSTWFEIDLRFALDLGPVKVSGATVRATLGQHGAVDVSLRGLSASLNVPGVIDGTGAFRLIQKTDQDPGGFEASLALNVIPLGLNATGYLGLLGDLIIVTLDVALPGPLPIANSGLGLYGVGGVFGLNAAPKPPGPADDPIVYQLNWTADLAHLDHRPGGMMFGFSATIGTLPDLGFSFHAKAGILLGVPDLSFRAGLDGTLFAPVGQEGVGTFMGVLVIDSTGVIVGLSGEYKIPYLLDVVVPIGARFPSHDPDWFVHIGSDNITVPPKPIRGPGPIQAHILPDLLPVEAWAYIMVRGDGLERLGGDANLNFPGFALGIGVGFQQRCGIKPIYLELSASALIGLATHPLILAGTGHFDGSLHLGPVSIGVEADVQLQVGPGAEMWADFHACASVDLFFFDLEGCVDVTVGQKTSTIPDPGEWPLLRVGLSDHLYRSRNDAAVSAADAPVVWPDVIPILQFAVGPASALAEDSAPQFLSQLTVPGQGGVWVGNCGGDGKTGSDELRYTYSLAGLRLVEVDGGAETLVAGKLADGSAGLEACWLVPKSGDATNRSGARELALLGWETQLWMRRLIDGGAGLPGDPISGVTNYCHPDRTPRPGWALGRDALRIGGDWRLPPEGLPPDPFLSRVDLTVHVTWAGQTFNGQTVAGMPAPALYDPPKIESLAAAVDIGRPLSAAFDLPEVATPASGKQEIVVRVEPNQLVAEIMFAEPASHIELYLAVTKLAVSQVHVSDAKSGVWDTRPLVAMPDGRSAIVITRRAADDPLPGLSITYPMAIHIAILGVRAITSTAKQNADDANNGAKAAASNNKQKKDQPVADRRNLLKPGKLYRIDVDMSCVGERNNGGSATFPPPPALHSQSFWFKTAPLEPLPLKSGSRGYLKSLAWEQSRLDISQLERYLLGYDPLDHSTNWLCGDPVAVHFAVDHVAALAKLYGHGFKLRLTRIDAPPAQSPSDGSLVLILTELERKDLASEIDQRIADQIAAALSPCPLPQPGVTAKAKPALEPQARYSLAVHLPSTAGGPEAILPGVVFQTSRFRNELELFADLGFTAAASFTVSGDLPVEAAQLLGPAVLVSDAGLNDALTRLGLGPWPLARKGRTSALWKRDGAVWKLAGVLLESPEPIDRPGRIVLKGLRSGAHQFEVLRGNASATRILYFTASPFVPTLPLTLQAEVHPTLPWPAPPGPFSIGVNCKIGAVPLFAGEI